MSYSLEIFFAPNVQAGLALLIETVGSVEATGEAIYSTLFEAAPSASATNCQVRHRRVIDVV